MLRAKTAMGFRSVKRVEVKAETTTPGEVRTTTDANGMRVSTSRARRTLPKLEFVVEESGAILHGPQRGLFPYYSTNPYFHTDIGAAPAPNVTQTTTAEATATSAAQAVARGREFAASTTAGHMGSNQDEAAMMESSLDGLDMLYRGSTGAYLEAPMSRRGSLSNPAPMKDCVLNDTRATTLAIKYDHSVNKFVCGSSIERFSGHTGVCRVLGSKKYPIIPHNLQIGDLLRIGSVGLVVCELNRGADEHAQESLTEEEYQYIKENYLSAPLQQTFRPTDSRSNNGVDGEEEDEEEEDDEDEDERRLQGRQHKLRSGETSDEGESEEDGLKRASEDGEEDHGGPGGVRGKTQRFKDGFPGSREKRFCYICYDDDEEPEQNPLVAPCNCKGDTKYVHLECLQRWNNNLDADGSNPNHKMCSVTNTEGLDVCSICKATYLTSVKLEDGRVVSLMAKKLAPPYVTFAVVTQHETRSRSTALTNTRFQLSFANIPRGQQFLTIGRSTTNNMTLRYRTVSQLHAKVKFEDNNFYMYDASSSNGTMLFLSRPLELDWNKTMHVKIGRTILTLKSKKRWKWSGGGECEEEGMSSPRAATAGSSTPRSMDSNQAHLEQYPSEGVVMTSRQPVNRFEFNSSPLVTDPSAELLSSPFAATLRQPLNRTFSTPLPYSSHQFSRTFLPPSDLTSELDNMRLSDLVDEGTVLGTRNSLTGGYIGTPRRSFGITRSYQDAPLPESSIPRISSRYMDRRDRSSLDYAERHSSATIGSPHIVDRLSGQERFD